MEKVEFEKILDDICRPLSDYLKNQKGKISAKDFENKVREELHNKTVEKGYSVDLEPPAQEFPDIIYKEKFGIEVKYSENNTWRSIANSIFEGRRNQDVKYIYLLFGKSGGEPEARWNKYEECIVHVRTSHVPRFEVEINTKKPLFEKLGIKYEEFRMLSQEDKMPYIREYAKERLKKGEHLWWIDSSDDGHTLPLEVKLYTQLTKEEKRKYRAESALLCPQVIGHSRQRGKYDDATMYLLTYHGILCNQARDLFTAGSVALRADGTRGGSYLIRALKDIEKEILSASLYLEDSLFIEYWGYAVERDKIIDHWLGLLDKYSVGGLKPSELIFN